MTLGAGEALEPGLTGQNGCLDLRIIRNDSSRDGHDGLEQGGGGNVGPRDFVGHSVYIGIGSYSEFLCRVHAMMMIESAVRELAQGDDIPRLMEGVDDQARRNSRSPRVEALRWPALHFRGIPIAENVTAQGAERDAFRC